MGNENGEWIMRGMDWDDPWRIRSWQELVSWIDEIGFLPLFANEIPGFSVEEHTASGAWWTDDPEQDPWAWRAIIAENGALAYGKFYEGRAGFVSREWLPLFCCARRDGYDFEGLWEDQKANIRSKHIMDQFAEHTEWQNHVLKARAGFGKGGEKGYEGTIMQLQMQTFLCVRAFRQKKNKLGMPYGWATSVYTTPEHLLGEEAIAAGLETDPEEARAKIREKIGCHFFATGEQLEQMTRAYRI